MKKILEILVPLILIVILLACMLNDGDGFTIEENSKSKCGSGFTVGGLYEGFSAGEDGSDKTAKITMVRADWCGFCKKAKPEWEKLTKKLKGSVVKGHKLIFRDLEHKRDEEEIKSKYPDVQGYPTYVVETKENGKLHKKRTFNGITQDAMEKGIHESL